MNYMNIEQRIVINNMERYERTGIIDLEYLGRLSTDVVPPLKEMQVKHPDLVSIQATIDRVKADSGDYSWPSWNLSKYQARR